MLRAIAFHVMLGLVGAGVVHIAILFLIPALTDRDSWARLSAATPPFEIMRVSAEPGREPLVRAAGPLFEAAACRFALDGGLLHVKGPEAPAFWSLSVYDRAGRNLYSFNDRTAEDGKLDLVVLTPLQLIELRKAPPETFERSLFVETGEEQGMVVVRAFAPDPAWRPAVLEFLDGIGCEPA